MPVWSLGWEDPLEKEMATYSSILAWRIAYIWESQKNNQKMGIGDTTAWHDTLANLRDSNRVSERNAYLGVDWLWTDQKSEDRVPLGNVSSELLDKWLDFFLLNFLICKMVVMKIILWKVVILLTLMYRKENYGSETLNDMLIVTGSLVTLIFLLRIQLTFYYCKVMLFLNIVEHP